jgi:Serine hydrolase (FSH1)
VPAVEPLRAALITEYEVHFQYVQPLYKIHSLPNNLAEYAGPGPYRGYVEYPRQATVPGLLWQLNATLGVGSAEQVWRGAYNWFYPTESSDQRRFVESIGQSVRYLKNTIDQDGPFDGVIGYCEGASFGAAVIFDCITDDLPNPFKCALFYSRYAPYCLNGSKFILADEVGRVFHFPTCHVIGSDDPMVDGCTTLLNLCDTAQATVVEGGAGHLMPQDSFSIEAVNEAFRKLVETVRAT